MIILTLRTDRPDASISLYDNEQRQAHITWEAHRQLTDMIHLKLQELVATASRSLNDIQGIVIFRGPGSFTGLRIGVSVANALAYGLHIPIVGQQTESWEEVGIKRLLQGESDAIVIPDYGSDPHITAPKK